jgi:hypothetical protein
VQPATLSCRVSDFPIQLAKELLMLDWPGPS